MVILLGANGQKRHVGLVVFPARDEVQDGGVYDDIRDLEICYKIDRGIFYDTLELHLGGAIAEVKTIDLDG